MNIQAARTASAEPVLLRENDGPVAVLTLNRPAARNSLSEALLGALGDALARHRDGQQRARRGARGQRPGVLRRPRPQGADRAAAATPTAAAPISSRS